MTPNRWYDERFLKCNNCKKQLMVFPFTDNKFFRCKYCGTKVKNKSYYLIIKKYKHGDEKYF